MSCCVELCSIYVQNECLLNIFRPILPWNYVDVFLYSYVSRSMCVCVWYFVVDRIAERLFLFHHSTYIIWIHLGQGIFHFIYICWDCEYWLRVNIKTFLNDILNHHSDVSIHCESSGKRHSFRYQIIGKSLVLSLSLSFRSSVFCWYSIMCLKPTFALSLSK